MDKSAEQIINLLRAAIYANPQLRIGQIMVIVARMGGWNLDDIFYTPDEMILKGLKAFVEGGTNHEAET